MGIIYEKTLNSLETADLLWKHPGQVRHIENLPDSFRRERESLDAASILTDIRLRNPGEEPLRYVRELSEEYAIKLVSERPENFKSIKNPTEAVCVALVEKKPLWLDLIPDDMRTPRVLYAAVEANPEAIRLLSDDEKTPEICLEAVTRDELLLINVPEEIATEEFFMELVRDSGHRIHSVPNPSKAVCLEAVKDSPESIYYIQSWSHPSLKSQDDRLEVYIEAARRNPDFGYGDDQFDTELGSRDNIDGFLARHARDIADNRADIKDPVPRISWPRPRM